MATSQSDGDWRDYVARATSRLSRAQSRVAECRAALRLAVADEKTATRELSEIALLGAIEPLPPSQVSSIGGVYGQRDAWRFGLVSELRLPPVLLNRLRSLGIETIGQLEDFRAWPKGVGKGKLAAINNAQNQWLDRFRERERQYLQSIAD